MEKPVIGITADIEFRAGENPGRPFYILDSALVAAIEGAGGIPLLLPHNRENIINYLDLIDGLIVSGDSYRFTSPGLFPNLADDVTDPATPDFKLQRTRFELALTKEALAQDIPLLAICAGFQILNVVVGGEIIVSLNEEPGIAAYHRQSEPAHVTTHPVHIPENTVFRGIIGSAELQINSIHSQGIRLADKARAAAIAPDGLVEAIEIPGQKFCIGTQWHPEFLLENANFNILKALVKASRTQ